jgi:hypothetical protein
MGMIHILQQIKIQTLREEKIDMGMLQIIQKSINIETLTARNET